MTYTFWIEILIFSSFGNLLNAFVLYPIALFIISRFFKKKVETAEEYRPGISILISAYNEEKLISDAVASIYNSEYPNELIRVIVGSDGSDDNTINILNELKTKYDSLEVYDLPRSGKNRILNILAEKVETPLLFYMDADLRIQNGTISKLTEQLSDTEVGAAMAAVKIVVDPEDENAGVKGESLYQKLETYIRIWESSVSSTVNSLGTLYGIKTELYQPLPNDRVCDDLYRILITSYKKKRVIFVPDAIVTEVREKSLGDELGRRIRLAAGGLSAVWEVRDVFIPFKKGYAWMSFALYTHKILRWSAPIMLIGILLGAILLPEESMIYDKVMIGQAVLYGGGLIGWILEKMKINLFPFRILVFFLSMNIGFLLGIFRFIARKQNSAWLGSELSKENILPESI
ncbi:MAG: glycosyltransferase [Candidatus Kapabacteria bacterium]|jgi:biofilm PGA synthesis N-glycosyltransferase PgaC|nr:glycosyltransferase [Candidatus Kapabacteria bacterium]